MLSWNKLPSDVKNSESLDIFKSNLELFKSKTRALGIYGCGNYWEISDEALNRIEAGSYLENKMRHNHPPGERMVPAPQFRRSFRGTPL